MARSKSSKKWLKEHFDDVFVKQSREDGYRSRAAYKLLEIQHKDSIIRSGMKIIDLGAAPGSWSQIAVNLVGPRGKVIALDILPIDPIVDVVFVQGDFQEPEVMERLLKVLNEQKIDLVISDMAPNMSGNKHIDIPRSMYLIELALDLAQRVLVPGGSLLVKIFHGSGFEQLLSEMRKNFEKVIIRKPAASRNRSKECYLLAKNYKL